MIYAVDFGTSNSLLAASVDGKVAPPIPLDPHHEDQSVFRSLIYFPNEGGVFFGQEAIKSYVDTVGEGRFLRSIKKFLPSASFTSTRIGNKAYRLEELIGRFLREMKTRADQHFDQDVESVVLGRPAKFSMNQEEDELAQSRLEEAARSAGFKSVAFFPEPLAAAYDFRADLTEDKIVLVVDLGGGTSDFTVMRMGPGRFKDEDVLSIGGVSVAGDALDGSIMSQVVGPHLGTETKYKMPMGSNVLTMSPELKSKLSSPADITLLSRTDIMRYLKDVRKAAVRDKAKEQIDRLFVLIEDNLGFPVFEEIERAKKEVCMEGKSQITYSYPDFELEAELEYSQFKDISEAKVDKIFSELNETLQTASVTPDQVDFICCTGGTSRVPVIVERLEKMFGPDRMRTRRAFHSVIGGLAERACDLET